MKKIRIYYECLEQANDYIVPLIYSFSKSIEILLVKRPKKYSQLSEGSIRAIQYLTTPDILISGIADKKEYPLVLIEYTEAVTTEDHELQRTYGAVAACLSNMYYVKISGHKHSEKVFGGAEYNPYSTPKILKEKLNYEGFIIADWKTEADNIYNLQRSNNLYGCPPHIQILADTIQCSISEFLKKPDKWFSNSLLLLKSKVSYKNFYKKVEKATSSVELIQTWKKREERNSNLNQLRYFVRKSWIGEKINRFDHAIDPDRGILTFISFVFSESHKIYGVYALVRSGTKGLKDELTDLQSLKYKFAIAIEKDKSGIPKWFIDELKESVNKAKKLNEEINFQPIWKKHLNKIADNKVVMTLAYFLDGIFLNHNGIKLYWNRNELMGSNNLSFLEKLSNYFNFTNYTLPTPIEEVKNDVDEDEVTYTIAHRVLIPNKFRIVSISYPGSQGGGAILPEPEKGKAQPREYPDIIALPPENIKDFDVMLNESKGMFNQSAIEKDLAKILKYKYEEKYLTALKETLVVAKVIDENDNIHNIIIGIAFGAKNSETIWKPDEVDFIFRIVNREKWSIGIFKQVLRDLIPEIEGNTNFPVVYKIFKERINNQLKIL